MIQTTKGYVLLDELDEQLIRILSDNARATNTEIGKQLGISHVAVGTRIRTLEAAGVIKGYIVDVDWDKVLVRMRT